MKNIMITWKKNSGSRGGMTMKATRRGARGAFAQTAYFFSQLRNSNGLKA